MGAKKALGEWAVKIGTSSGEEALEEILQLGGETALQDVAQEMGLTKEDAELLKPSFAEYLDNGIKGFIGGFALGGTIGGVQALATNSKEDAKATAEEVENNKKLSTFWESTTEIDEELDGIINNGRTENFAKNIIVKPKNNVLKTMNETLTKMRGQAPIFFASTDKTINGIYNGNSGKVYINVNNATKNPLFTFGHEFFHYAEQTMPEQSKAFTISLFENLTNTFPEYAQKLQKLYGTTDFSKIQSEHSADVMGDLFLDKKLWKSMNDSKLVYDSRIKQVANKVIEFIDFVLEKLGTGSGAIKYVKELEAVRAEAIKLINAGIKQSLDVNALVTTTKNIPSYSQFVETMKAEEVEAENIKRYASKEEMLKAERAVEGTIKTKKNNTQKALPQLAVIKKDNSNELIISKASISSIIKKELNSFDELNDYESLLTKEKELEELSDKAYDEAIKSGKSSTEAMLSIADILNELNDVIAKQLNMFHEELINRISTVTIKYAKGLVENVLGVKYNSPSAGLSFQILDERLKDSEKLRKKIVTYLVHQYGENNNLDMELVLESNVSGWGDNKIRYFYKKINATVDKIIDAIYENNSDTAKTEHGSEKKEDIKDTAKKEENTRQPSTDNNSTSDLNINNDTQISRLLPSTPKVEVRTTRKTIPPASVISKAIETEKQEQLQPNIKSEEVKESTTKAEPAKKPLWTMSKKEFGSEFKGKWVKKVVPGSYPKSTINVFRYTPKNNNGLKPFEIYGAQYMKGEEIQAEAGKYLQKQRDTIINEAAKRGEVIPDNVLKDYPQLKGKEAVSDNVKFSKSEKPRTKPLLDDYKIFLQKRISAKRLKLTKPQRETLLKFYERFPLGQSIKAKNGEDIKLQPEAGGNILEYIHHFLVKRDYNSENENFSSSHLAMLKLVTHTIKNFDDRILNENVNKTGVPKRHIYYVKKFNLKDKKDNVFVVVNIDEKGNLLKWTHMRMKDSQIQKRKDIEKELIAKYGLVDKEGSVLDISYEEYAKRATPVYLGHKGTDSNLSSKKQLEPLINSIPQEDNKNNIKFSLIGEKGATALDQSEEATTRLDNLSIAREMETAGKDVKAIRLATGWERGADKKWRYEIEDGEIDDNHYAEILQKKFNENIQSGLINATTLGALYKNKALYNSYPELESMSVVLYEKSNSSLASYNVSEKAIYIYNPLSLNTINNLNSTLLHEIQHAIQEIEGFAKGGNLKTNLDSKTAKEVTAVETVLNKAIELKNSGKWIYEDASLAEIINADTSIEQNIKQWALNIAKKGNKEVATFLKETPYAQYKRLAGEVEARNVQSRMNLTPEQRRETLLKDTEDVAREDQIFLDSAFKSDNVKFSKSDNEIEIEELRKQYQNTDKWLKGPNGKPTNLNVLQWLQVRTQAFKNWFGDWENSPETASKVLDENGEPLVVYHGTNKDFEVFKVGDLGFHFGTEKQANSRIRTQANKGVRIHEMTKDEAWQDTNIIPVYLKTKNLIETKDYGSWHNPTTIAKKLLKDNIITKEEYNSLTFPFPNLPHDERNTFVLRQLLINKGIDGIKYINRYEYTADKQYSYIVLTPTQIKSATGNIGTFDGANPNIKFSKSLSILGDKKIKIHSLKGHTFTNKSLSDAIKTAKEWMKENLFTKSVVNEDSNIEIAFTNKSLHALHPGHPHIRQHLEFLKHVQTLLKNAKLLDTHADIKNEHGLLKVHVFANAFEMNGRYYAVKMTVKEFKNEIPYYDHNLTEIKNLDFGRANPDESVKTPSANRDNITLAEISKYIKGYENYFDNSNIKFSKALPSSPNPTFAEDDKTNAFIEHVRPQAVYDVHGLDDLNNKANSKINTHGFKNVMSELAENKKDDDEQIRLFMNILAHPEFVTLIELTAIGL